MSTGGTRAIRLTRWGGPPVLTEVARPTPRGEEVLVRVEAAGLCRSDLHVLDAAPNSLPYRTPFTLGHEVAGRVAARGPEAFGPAIGERVVVYGPWGCGRCARCSVGADNHCDERPALDAARAGTGRGSGATAEWPTTCSYRPGGYWFRWANWTPCRPRPCPTPDSPRTTPWSASVRRSGRSERGRPRGRRAGAPGGTDPARHHVRVRPRRGRTRRVARPGRHVRCALRHAPGTTHGGGPAPARRRHRGGRRAGLRRQPVQPGARNRRPARGRRVGRRGERRRGADRPQVRRAPPGLRISLPFWGRGRNWRRSWTWRARGFDGGDRAIPAVGSAGGDRQAPLRRPARARGAGTRLSPTPDGPRRRHHPHPQPRPAITPTLGRARPQSSAVRTLDYRSEFN